VHKTKKIKIFLSFFGRKVKRSKGAKVQRFKVIKMIKTLFIWIGIAKIEFQQSNEIEKQTIKTNHEEAKNSSNY